MWIKFSREIRNCAVIQRCAAPRMKRDNTCASRQLICIDILTDSADDMSWANAAELSRQSGHPLKSCEVVWQICIDEKVLRPRQDGRYSAKAWLLEKHFIGDSRPATPPPIPPQAMRQPQTTSITGF